MRILAALFFSSLLHTISHAQYTGPTGVVTVTNNPAAVVRTLQGPINQIVTVNFFNFAYCRQTEGAESEPCPWTLPFQTLYDNQWDYDVSKYLVYNGTGQINLVSPLRVMGGPQRWVKTATGGGFARQTVSQVWEEEKWWVTGG